jgi:hypothetical protein
VYITDSTPSTKAVNKHVNFPTPNALSLSLSPPSSSLPPKVEPLQPTSNKPESTKINIKLEEEEEKKNGGGKNRKLELVRMAYSKIPPNSKDKLARHRLILSKLVK